MSRTARTFGIVFVHLVALIVGAGFFILNRQARLKDDRTPPKVQPSLDELDESVLSMLERRALEADNSPSDPFAETKAIMRRHLEERRFDQARTVLEELHRGQLAQLGERHPDTIASTVELAVVRMRSRQVAEAIPMLERSLELIRETPGINPSLLFDAQFNLGIAYNVTRQPERAIELLEPSLAWKVSKAGETHPGTLQIRSLLAQCFWAIGKHDRAITLMEQSVAALTSSADDHGLQLVIARESLAMMLEGTGNREKALELLEDAVAECSKAVGVADQRTLRVHQHLIASYFAMGKSDLALAGLEGNLTTLAAALPPDHEALMQARMNLVTGYRQVHEPERALDHQTVLTDMMRSKYGAEHPMLLVTRIYTTEILREARQFQQAEELLIELHQLITQSKFKLSEAELEKMRVENIRRLVQLYESWEKPALADEWRDKLPPQEDAANSGCSLQPAAIRV